MLFHVNISNKNTCKINCKMQYLKNGSQFIVSEGSASSINPTPTNVFWPGNRLQGYFLLLFGFLQFSMSFLKEHFRLN